MGFDLVTNIEQCLNLVRDYVPVSLVYYSHIPAVIASLFIGIAVFIKSGRTLVSKILLGIVVSFSFEKYFERRGNNL